MSKTYTLEELTEVYAFLEIASRKEPGQALIPAIAEFGNLTERETAIALAAQTNGLKFAMYILHTELGEDITHIGVPRAR